MRTTAFLPFLFLFLLPLMMHGQVRFIENKGQWNENILYKASISGGSAFITPNAIRYVFADKNKLHQLHHGFTDDSIINFHAVFIEFVNANRNPIVSHSKPFSEYYNYYTSRNPEKWKSGVKPYGRILNQEIFPSTDLEIESEDDAIKYTYVVKPGGSPSKIQMRVRGADKLEIKDEELHIYTSLNHIVEQKPFAYQLKGNDTVKVKCNFYLDKDILGFRFPDGYDKSFPLVIDPKVIFATYSGSLGDNFGFTATYDKLGNGYSGGTVYDVGFPTTPGAFQEFYHDGDFGNSTIEDYPRDIGILKYSPDGTKLLFATYLGGSHNEEPHSMVVDSLNNLIVFGTTFSIDFPVTKTAFDTTYNTRGDIFLTKFSEDGTQLLAGTYIGDSLNDGLNGLKTGSIRADRPLSFNYGDQFRGEVVSDKFNNIYVAASTQSPKFPVTAGAAQTKFGGGAQDGCAFKLNPDFSKLLWSTFIGGSNYDAAFSIQLDKKQNAFITGGTISPYFFKDSVTYQDTIIGDSADAFICHLKNDGKTFINATYFGTNNYDQAYFVQLDTSENVFIFGQTLNNNFPIINSKYVNPGSRQFITKFNYNLDSVLISTVFGSGPGKPNISPAAFLVDNCGSIYVSGWGGHTNEAYAHGGNTFNLPITPDGFQKTTDGSDFYVAVFARDMEALLFSSYFGGNISEEHVDGGTSRFDKRGVIYQSVCGGCATDKSLFPHSDFPTTPGAWSRINKSDNCNNLLFKVDLNVPDVRANFDMPTSACAPFTIKPTNKSVRANNYIWKFGDGTTSTLENPTHLYTVSDTYTVTLIAYNSLSCSLRDSISKQIYIYTDSKADFNYYYDSCSNFISFDTAGAGTIGLNFLWNFGDGAVSNLPKPTHRYNDTGVYTVTLVSDPGTACADTIKKNILIYKPDFSFSITDTCTKKVKITQLFTKDSNLLWIFDKDTTYNELPGHQYSTAGIHTITLIVIKSNGCVDTIKKTVNIPIPAQADFTLTSDSCTKTVTLKNLTSQKATRFLWTFGDGTQDTARNPLVHKYSSDGSYTVSLIVNPGSGCADTSTKTINLIREKAKFSYNIDSCTAEVQFINQSAQNVNSFLWLLEEGHASRARSPKYLFSGAGNKSVSLIIYPGTSCADTFSLTLQSDSLPGSKLSFPNVITLNGDGVNDEFRVQGFNYKCDDFELLIFNRWGQLLYHERGTDLSWKGTTLDGKIVEAGVYYFIFRSEATDLKQGTITVIK